MFVNELSIVVNLYYIGNSKPANYLYEHKFSNIFRGYGGKCFGLNPVELVKISSTLTLDVNCSLHRQICSFWEISILIYYFIIWSWMCWFFSFNKFIFVLESFFGVNELLEFYFDLHVNEAGYNSYIIYIFEGSMVLFNV